MEGVEELGEVERSVEDHVQTTTSANENDAQIFLGTHSLMHLEPAAQS